MPVNPLKVLLPAVLLALPSLTFAQEATPQPDSDGAPVAESPAPAGLQIFDSTEFDLDSYLWTNRVLAVFSDTPADTRYIKQMQMLNERPRDLLERDVVIVTDTDPEAKSDLRKTLRPRGFALVLIDKDGGIKLRKPSPWATREIARSIDKTPLRRQEIRDRTSTSLVQ